MLYGATGYTAGVILEKALARGLHPILAGRDSMAIRKLATKHNLPWIAFSLDEDPSRLDLALESVHTVLHCAGPFSKTSKPMVDACLRNQTNYLDITGEIAVFESIFQRHEEAVANKLSLIPGVGFDVVPTDCLAAELSATLPSATHPRMAFHGNGGLSRGTTKTMLENIHLGAAVRENGHIKVIPNGFLRREVPFADKGRSAMAIGWGDVSTAYRSTQIPNIEVYLSMPPKTITAIRLFQPLRGLLANKTLQQFLRSRVEKGPAGPSAEVRQRVKTQLWGEASDASGKTETITAQTAEGYEFTALAALAALERVMQGNIAHGALTPSMAFGADFWRTIPGTEVG
jgi:short subunit dehydrogenase-like uncharacterized protein